MSEPRVCPLCNTDYYTECNCIGIAYADRITELEGFIDAYCGQPDQTKVFDEFDAIRVRNTELEEQLVGIKKYHAMAIAADSKSTRLNMELEAQIEAVNGLSVYNDADNNDWLSYQSVMKALEGE